MEGSTAVGAAWFRERRISLVALGAVPVLGFAVGLVIAFAVPGGGPDPGGDADVVGTEAAATRAIVGPGPATSPAPTPTASPTGEPTPSTAAPKATRPTTARPGDRTRPTIGKADAQPAGIWTDFWCSAGPTVSEISIPVQDETDRAGALAVHVRFVLHREDGKTMDLDAMDVRSDRSPFAFKLGPYPGPNGSYTYSNVLDMVVTAKDRAGNTATRTFASFMTFNDCKA